MKKLFLTLGGLAVLIPAAVFAINGPSINGGGINTPAQWVPNSASSTITPNPNTLQVPCANIVGGCSSSITSSSVVTASSVTASIFDKGGAMFNVKAYGAKCDDVTDDTTAVNNAIAAAMAGNGTTTNTIYVSGMCLMRGAMVLPHFDSAGLTYQNPLRITGPAESWNGYWNGLTLTNYQGAGLDLQYNAPTSTSISTTTAVAKIDTRGAGLLEIDHLTLKDATSDNSLFFQTTNTTVFLHDLVFAGNPNCYQMTCLQPAIALGSYNGRSSGEGIQGSSSWSMFQGYGSEIYNIYFQNVDRVITFGDQANGVMVRNLTVSKSSGGAESSSAPYYFNGGNNGNAIFGGTTEVTGYHYTVTMVGANGGQNQMNYLNGIGAYDNTASTTGYIYQDVNSNYNTIIPGYLDPGMQATSTVTGPGAPLNTVITGQRFGLTTFGVGVLSSNYEISTGGSLNTVTAATPAGGNLLIDTGAGGSYLYTNAYSNRFRDQGGNIKAEIEAGAAGGGAYFLGTLSVGTSTLSATGQFMDPTNNSSTVRIGSSLTKQGCLEFGAASGTMGKLVFVWFDSNAAINATTTKPNFCM